MQVIDGIEVHILSVPGKGGLPHTKVEVSGVDSRDGHPIFIHHSIQDCSQSIDIPLFHTRLCQGT